MQVIGQVSVTLGIELTWPNTVILTLCQYSIIILINDD